MFVVPQEPGDAEMLAERIAPRLQHANSAVVLTAVKVIVYLMNYMAREEDIHSMCKKLSPPLGKLHFRLSWMFRIVTQYTLWNTGTNLGFVI